MNCAKALFAEYSENGKLLPGDVRVLVLDANPTCLTIISKMLRRSGYKVMTAKRGADALCIMREREDELDLVLAESKLPDMDKYELLETMGQISELPVVVMSGDANDIDMLGSLHKGATFHFVKPITMSDIQHLWQCVYINKKDTYLAAEGHESDENIESQPLMNDGKQCQQNEKRKEPEEMDRNEEDDDDSPVLKKPKLFWTNEIHNRFLQAIRFLGIDRAHPKTIHQYMNVPGLKKENISSHLQVLFAEYSENSKLLPDDVNVLLLDTDPTCLTIISKMLRRSGYKVMTAKQATDALCIMREREDELDLVLAESNLPDMDKYELLETMGQISELPVVIMSGDANDIDMLGSLHKGAIFHFVKPITMSDIKNLGQCVFINKRDTYLAAEGHESDENIESQPLMNDGKQCQQNEKRKEPEEMDRNEQDDDDSPVLKKPKLFWTNELHNRFLQAIRFLGIDRAHPKTILQYMNVTALKKENISSHLQKYRLSLKREHDTIQKTMNGDYTLSHFASYHPSATFNSHGGFIQFPELQCTAATFQPKMEGHLLKNLSSCMPTPSFASADFLKPVEHSCIDALNSKVAQMNLPINQLDMSNQEESYAALRITNSGELTSFQQMGNSDGPELLKGEMAHYCTGDFGLENSIHKQTLTINSVQEQQQQQHRSILLPRVSPLPPPPQHEQEEHDIFGAERVKQRQILLPQVSPLPPPPQHKHDIFGAEREELEELFDLPKGSAQVLLDENLNDLL